jgi:hypothetical protein
MFLLFSIVGDFIYQPDKYLTANMHAVAFRGKEIYVYITSVNTEREQLHLPTLWPKTCIAISNCPGDVSAKVFKTSTEYFEMLLEKNANDTSSRGASVSDIDSSKFSGAGVPRCPGGRKLTSTNNLWLIAANVTPEDADIIPILITRNVDVREIERLVNCGGATSNLNAKIAVGMGYYKTPFGEKGFVVVRKGGGIFAIKSRYAQLKYIFNAQTLPPRDPSKPPIVYLMP